MSGICGILYFDERRASPEEVSRMNKAISFRGKDETGARVEGPVALGNCLLRTTPESLHEHFPMEDAEAGLLLTADARIDNREDLIAALAIRVSSERPVTDGELILRAYRKWGEGCPEHLVGDFAFAIWDVRERALFCARDHFGARPFCYYLDKGRFLFASEVSGIIAIPDVPRRLDETFLVNFLCCISKDVELTGFRDVFRLPASHCFLLRTNGKMITRRYWRFDPEREIHFTGEEAYYEEFRERLFEAVECRCRSITPVAAELSCGLDSSMVAAAAQRFLQRSGRSLNTFSHTRIKAQDDFGNHMDDSKLPYETDERRLVELTVDRLGIKRHCHVAGGKDTPGIMEQMRLTLETCGAPKIFQYGFAADVLNRRVERGGMRVVLSGLGGDQIVSNLGRGYYAELARNRRWKALWDEAKGVSVHYKTSRYRFLFSVIILNRYPWIRYHLKRLFRGEADARELNLTKSGISRDFARRMNAFASYRHYRKQYILMDAIPGFSYKGHQILAAEWGYLPNSLEERSAAALLRSAECRYPLLDKRLAEYALAVPSHIKVRDGWRRRLARKSSEVLLPPEIVWRLSKHESGTVPYVKDSIMKDIAVLKRMAETTRNDPFVASYVNAPLVYDSACRIEGGWFDGYLALNIIGRGVMAAMFLNTVERVK